MKRIYRRLSACCWSWGRMGVSGGSLTTWIPASSLTPQIGLLTAFLFGLLVGHASAAAPVPNREGMVLIPAGRFIMGSGEGAADEAPPHQRDLPAYYIDRAEVTKAQYAEFLKQTNTPPPPDWSGPVPPKGTENLPITNITWFDAMRYAIWAGKRLPAEAEWEKAARGPDGRRYPWGNVDQEGRRNLDTSKRLEAGDSRPEGASPYGAMHLCGNAWEWTADWYDGYPGTAARSAHFGRQYKVVRGGGAEYLYGIPNTGTTTARARLLPYGAHDFVGFRCVKDVDPAKAPYDAVKLLAEAQAVLESFDRQPVELSYERELAGYLKEQRVPIRIAGVEGQKGYVRTGVPFPRGVLRDVRAIRVTSSAGQPRPVQARALANWPDGSVRWALLDFLGRAGEACEVRFGLDSGTPPPVGRELRIDESAGKIRVDTGVLTLSISPEYLVHDLRYRGRPWLDRMGIRLEVQAGQGVQELSALPAERVELETRGPLRAVARLQGRLGVEPGKPSAMSYDIRVHALAGSARLNVMVTLTHATARASRDEAVLDPILRVTDAVVSYTRPAGSLDLVVPMGRESKPVNARQRIELAQESELKFRVQADGQAVGEGQHAPGWLALPVDKAWLAFGARYFRQNHPDALMVTPEVIGLRFWAGEQPFEWEATLAKTCEIIIDAVASPEAGLDLDPLRATMPPAWACGSQAIGGPMLPRCPEAIERFPYWELMRESSMRQFVKGMPTGLRDFGDAYLGGPYKGKNAYMDLEYDVHFNFLMQFLRTGQVWYLAAAEPMARHQADIDTDHVTGQPYKHSPLHTTTRADIAHMFLRGLLLHHVLTGEERSFDVARRIGDHIAEQTARNSGYGNERQIGWGLYALTGLYDITRESKYLDAAKSLCDRLAAGQSPTGRFDIRWDNRIAFMNGLAMGGMLTVQEHTGDAKIAEMVLRVARRTWGMYPDYACRTLNAFCWGLERTKDPRFLDAMERTWISSMEYLRRAVNEETFAWRFTDFAARYQLFPLFERQPENLPDAASWRGVQLEETPVEVFVRPTSDRPAPVLVLLAGLVAGKVELFDASGALVEAKTLDDEARFFKPAALMLGDKRQAYRLRLTACGARYWQIHHDARGDLVLFDPLGKQLHELSPRAHGFIRDGAGQVKVRLEVMNEGYHKATLFDERGAVAATAQRFVDFEDPGRYMIELAAPVSGPVGGPWSLEVHDAKVVEIEGMLPYWAYEPGQLFNPERPEGTARAGKREKVER